MPLVKRSIRAPPASAVRQCSARGIIRPAALSLRKRDSPILPGTPLVALCGHWSAGLLDTRDTLAHAEWLEMPNNDAAFTTRDIHRARDDDGVGAAIDEHQLAQLSRGQEVDHVEPDDQDPHPD